MGVTRQRICITIVIDDMPPGSAYHAETPGDGLMIEENVRMLFKEYIQRLKEERAVAMIEEAGTERTQQIADINDDLLLLERAAQSITITHTQEEVGKGKEGKRQRSKREQACLPDEDG